MSQLDLEALEVLEEVRTTNKKIQRLRATLGTLLLIVILIYGGRIYGLFTGFDQQRFTESLGTSAQTVLPGLSGQMGDLTQELIPLYSDEILKQADDELPALQQRVEKEFALLKGEVESIVSARSEKLRVAVDGAIDTALTENYPELAKDPALRNQVRERMLSEFEAAANKSLSARTQAPTTQLKRLVEATSLLGEEAAAANAGRRRPAELRVVLSLLGLISRELTRQKTLLAAEIGE
jgi:hypothetical protein